MVWWDDEPGWQQIGGGNLTGTSHTHPDLAAGTTYYDSIRAVNATGETSDWLLEPYPSATVPAPVTAPPFVSSRATDYGDVYLTDGLSRL